MKFKYDRYYTVFNNNVITCLIFTSLLIFYALFVVGCAEKALTQKNKLETNAIIQKSMDPKKYWDQLGSMQEIPSPDLAIPKISPNKQRETEPLAGRLIVKIAPSEIENTFKPAATKCNKKLLIENSLLPGNLEIKHISYLGYFKDGRILLRIHLSRDYRLKELQAAFRTTKGKIFPIGMGEKLQHQSVVVAYEQADIKESFTNIFTPNFFHLKKTSQLNYLLKNAGVVTMRRVFHSVEQKDKEHPGYYRVVPFKSLLKRAKAENPVRSKRAFEYVYSKDLADIQSAYLKYYGHAMSPINDETIINVRENLKPYLRIPVRVPENMENYFVLTLSPGKKLPNLEKAKTLLSRYKFIHHVSYDYPLKLATNDPYYANQWGLENNGTFLGTGGGLPGFDIKANQAWASKGQQIPIVVAVVDDGFKENLNELRYRVWTNQHEVVNGQDDDGNGFMDDVHGITTGLFIENDGNVNIGLPSGLYGTHGTKVAGVIAAEADNNFGISGVAGRDDVKLINLSLGSFSDAGTPCGFAEFAQAIWYAIAPSVDPGYPLTGADIVNVSVSGPCTTRTYLPHDIMMAALDAGLIIVASAGNDGMSFLEMPDSVCPACLPGVITVGGSQRDGRWWNSSNFGYLIDLVAPAKDVLTTTFNPDDLSQTQAIITDNPPSGGTSMSAAFVSGGAAVVLGRFPDITAPFMDDWLRAKACDITDPLGDGSTHTGDDVWTGAGMLDIGNAAQSALNLADRPINVELTIDTLKRFAFAIDAWVPSISFAVSGNPLIGVRVQGETISEWTLSYGLGELSDQGSYTQFYNSNSASNYETDSLGYVISGGISPLNTDSLINGQLYTMRLQATNQAGTKFNAYALFRPTRAKITFPTKNYVIVPNRGWLQLAGYAHIKPGESYSVSVTTASGGVLWNSPDYANPYLDYPVTSGLFHLMNNAEPESTVGGNPYCGHFTNAPGGHMPMFPINQSILNEGFINYVLRVGSETDSLRLYVDNANFPTNYWPILNEPVSMDTIYGYPIDDFSDYSTCFNADSGRHYDHLIVIPSLLDTRLLISHNYGLTALDRNGTRIWQAIDEAVYWRIHGNIVVDDIDRDNVSEVLFSLLGREYWGAPWHEYLYILDSRDGSLKYGRFLLNISGIYEVGNLSADSRKEIIINTSISDASGRPLGSRIAVLDLNGSTLWQRDFSKLGLGELEVADIDGDGFDEILITGTGQILRGNNTFQSGWATEGNYKSAHFVYDGTSYNVALNDGNNIYLKSLSGATRPGFPIAGSEFTIGKISQLGDNKIIIYSDRIKTYDLSGSTTAGTSPIDINGRFGGLELHDVDSDGNNELIVLVDRYSNNPADGQLNGNFLEVYKILGGARLADTDNRWPINISDEAPNYDLGSFKPEWHKHFTIGDVDGDGKPEVLQLINMAPYHRECRYGRSGIRVEVTHIGN